MAGNPKYDRGEYKRNLNLKVRYGITSLEFDSLLESQNGGCAICGIKKNLVIDHCHNTKIVRGILCKICNFVIGWYGDDSKRVEQVINYLSKSSASIAQFG
jgi:hypothetical protein